MDPCTALVLAVGVVALGLAPLLAFLLAWHFFGRVLDRDAQLYGKLLEDVAPDEDLFDGPCLCDDCRARADEEGEED